MERAVLFGQSRTLVGVVTEPEPAGGVPEVAFVFLNAGVVHRVGPNRIYVTAARRLAAVGFLGVRFDLAGIGDSPVRRDTTPFEQAAVEDAREVIAAVHRDYGVSRFVLVGLCSGAVLAFRTAIADERVVGAVLINPQGFAPSAEWNNYVVNRTLARRYWREKLFSVRSWRQALTGRTNYRQLAAVLLRRALSTFRPDDAVERVAGQLAADFRHLTQRGVRFLLACSEGDFGVDYLSVILGPRFARLRDMAHLTLPAGDHSLTMAVSQRMFFDGVERWAQTCAFATVRTAAGAEARAVETPAYAAARGRLS